MRSATGTTRSLCRVECDNQTKKITKTTNNHLKRFLHVSTFTTCYNYRYQIDIIFIKTKIALSTCSSYFKYYIASVFSKNLFTADYCNKISIKKRKT